ncbi:Uncharacterised protein [Candidatus Tiddalikarchaeum anstoanum]|nr:Uncharacterised protein [Candidatus Tiddalikarchaeum anstoanum]
MISVNSEGISVDRGSSENISKLLWDFLSVTGTRFNMIVLDCSDEVEYAHNFKFLKHKNARIGVFSVTNEDEYQSLISAFSEATISDFYITANTSFNVILDTCNNPEFYDDQEGFLIKAYLLEYPQTIHIEETGFFIDFNNFKTVKYQLTNVAKKYEAKSKK